AAGTLTLPKLGDPSVVPVHNQAGNVRINSGATLSTGGNDLANLPSASLGGSGTLDLGGATLTNAGALQPGGSTTSSGTTGTLTVNGNLALAPGGHMDVKLAGSGVG